MVDVSSALRSKERTEPSAPADAKTLDEAGDQTTSNTSLSCALVSRKQQRHQLVLIAQVCLNERDCTYMSCVTAEFVDMSQTVHVVSIELVTMYEGLIVDQSKEVRGAGRSLNGFYADKVSSQIT